MSCVVSVYNVTFLYPNGVQAISGLSFSVHQHEKVGLIGPSGAGKTTLMRYLFQKLRQERVAAAQLVSTRLDPDDALRMVAAAFGLSYEGLSKAALLLELERFMRKCEREGTRALLVVDEAQNLLPQTLEELRMLSNFQSDNRPLLQTFLLGQPEFRRTLLGSQMQQLRQRVIATYHLGPPDQAETRAWVSRAGVGTIASAPQSRGSPPSR